MVSNIVAVFILIVLAIAFAIMVYRSLDAQHKREITGRARTIRAGHIQENPQVTVTDDEALSDYAGDAVSAMFRASF
jgi:hypothetical protein